MIRFSEAIKFIDGAACHMEYHQQRVDRTLADFDRPSLNLSEVEARLPRTARRGLYKCRVLYSDCIEQVEFQPYTISVPKSVAVVRDDTIDYSYKFADRSRLNGLVQRAACDEVLIVKNGLVTDASVANLVFRSSEGLFTPADCLLKGTKRQQLLDHRQIQLRRIGVDDIPTYDAIYFINAMVDLSDERMIRTSCLRYSAMCL